MDPALLSGNGGKEADFVTVLEPRSMSSCLISGLSEGHRLLEVMTSINA